MNINAQSLPAELHALIPKYHAASLFALLSQEEISDDEFTHLIEKLLQDIDWESSKHKVGKIFSQLLPIEQLVPECYSDWRPIVNDALHYIATHLSAKRLLPKLIDQISLSESASIEARIILFIKQMPSLQKLGQVIARNRNLSQTLRDELISLENGIRDIEVEPIKAEIEQQLINKCGSKLKDYKVEYQNDIHAEASVCALLRFSWQDESGERQQGIFKVIKPYINEYFDEEMQLLQGLAAFLEGRKHEHVLKQVDLYALFDDIRKLLQGELDVINEQANLKQAYDGYQNVQGVRIPKLIEPLSTSGLIAMRFEPGVKVTEAYSKQSGKRRWLACKLLEALIAIPLFSDDECRFFHADPHAGNLLLDETSDELVMLDWALVEQMDAEQRRQLLMLISAVMLRDDTLLINAIITLAREVMDKTILEQHVHRFIKQLPLYTIPGIKDVLTLLDEILLLGISFSKPLLAFRKVLLTLDGVLNDIDDGVVMETVLTNYVLQNAMNDISNINFIQQTKRNFRIPLSFDDGLSLTWSAQWYAYRTALQTASYFLEKNK